MFGIKDQTRFIQAEFTSCISLNGECCVPGIVTGVPVCLGAYGYIDCKVGVWVGR